MPLHHRAEIANMRNAYDYDKQSQRYHTPDSTSDRSSISNKSNSNGSYRCDTNSSNKSNNSYNTLPTSDSGSPKLPPVVSQRHNTSASNSNESYRYDSNSSKHSNKSYSTPPTSYSGSVKLPPVVHHQRPATRSEDVQRPLIIDAPRSESPIPIEATDGDDVVSTTSSIEEVDEDEEDDIPGYDPPEYTRERFEPSAIPARPSDFSKLFPSHRRLDIRHDDSTPDGNMNLRVDTEVNIHGRKCDMTLFHLRMHDLRNREFSLRRYCRDSGREVCKSSRKQQKAGVERRPGIQRSLSNALHSMRPKLEQRSYSGSHTSGLKRHDSGYGSMHSTDEEFRPASSAGSEAKGQDQPLSNTMKLEFSNYAQMDVSYSKDKKGYEFSYWNGNYVWKRVTQKGSNEVSFHLVDRKQSNKKVLAYIRPIPLTDFEAANEQNSGGWIPQCMMWIADEGIVNASKDVSDAIISAGLMALVDDSIRARFHQEESTLLMIPLAKLHVDMDYVGPTRLINEMFNKKDSKLDSGSTRAFSDGASKRSRATSGSTRPSSRDH